MIYAVIMAGGSGTRFWPLSRRARPKQLLAISGTETMLQVTVRRILPEIPVERIMVVSGLSHLDEIRSQLPHLDEGMLVGEPRGRNTAPCIALAAFKLHKKDPDAIMVVLPADHMISKVEEFRAAVRVATHIADRGDVLLTFGIVPNRPETGYGYVKLGDPKLQVHDTTVYEVDRFEEKPDRPTAEQYVSSGQYMWNSGMFVWKATDIINSFDKHLPSVSNAMRNLGPLLDSPCEAGALTSLYETVEAVSIDYGVMEKADNVLCIPIDVGWNDVGSWASMGDLWDIDSDGNASRGETVMVESRQCVVSSPHRLTALIGIDDLIVVDTPDALMICRKDKAQEVRRLQEALKGRGYGHLL